MQYISSKSKQTHTQKIPLCKCNMDMEVCFRHIRNLKGCNLQYLTTVTFIWNCSVFFFLTIAIFTTYKSRSNNANWHLIDRSVSEWSLTHHMPGLQSRFHMMIFLTWTLFDIIYKDISSASTGKSGRIIFTACDAIPLRMLSKKYHNLLWHQASVRSRLMHRLFHSFSSALLCLHSSSVVVQANSEWASTGEYGPPVKHGIHLSMGFQHRTVTSECIMNRDS